MKKTLIIIILFCSISVFAQRKVGSVATPYSTTGWDLPADSTTYYNLFVSTLMTNPGGYLNLNWVKIDSLLNELIVLTDLKQLWIVNDSLRFSDSLSWHGQFSTTSQYDTTVVPGADSLDVVVVSVRENIPSANDLLSVKVITDTVIVQRPASGTSGLKYNCIWIRKYQ
jgi:hypothetical protein